MACIKTRWSSFINISCAGTAGKLLAEHRTRWATMRCAASQAGRGIPWRRTAQHDNALWRHRADAANVPHLARARYHRRSIAARAAASASAQNVTGIARCNDGINKRSVMTIIGRRLATAYRGANLLFAHHLPHVTPRHATIFSPTRTYAQHRAHHTLLPRARLRSLIALRSRLSTSYLSPSRALHGRS